jgi:hypothetical protein
VSEGKWDDFGVSLGVLSVTSHALMGGWVGVLRAGRAR